MKNLILPILILCSVLAFSQTRRVPLTLNGADMTSNIKTVLADASIEVVELERSGLGEILVNGAIDFKGKVIKVSPGTTVKGSYLIRNAVIDANPEEYTFATTGTFENVRSISGELSVKWFGADGSDQLDDYAAIQKAVDVAIVSGGIGVVSFPTGHYITSKGINIRRSDGAGLPSKFVSLTLRGAVSSFDTGPIGAATTITTTNPEGFVFNIQRGKGCVIEYIYHQGQNRLNLSPEQVVDDKTNWNVNGSDKKLAPHAGVVIDGFGQPSVPLAERYSDYTDLYTEVGIGGSTDVIIRNCAFRYFVVGVAVSPNSTTQNAEIIKVEDCWIDYAKVCVSAGNSQTRTVIVENLKSWGNVETVIDAERYGGGGAIPELRGANFAGSVKYLLRTTNTGLPVAVFNDVYAETLYAIGGRLGPGASTLQLNLLNCQLNFMGGEQSTSTPSVIVRCNQLNIIGGLWTYYSHNTYQPMPIDCPITTVVGVALYGLLWDINLSNVQYTNVKVHALFNSPLNTNNRTTFPGIEDGRMVAAEGSYVYGPGQKRTYTGPFVTIDYADAAITIIDPDHVSFNLSGNSAMVGDYVMVQGYGGRVMTDLSTNSTGYYFVLGIIESFNGGIVVVKNIPHHLDLSAGQYRFYVMQYLTIYKTHIGDITKGSNVISNILGEGNSVTQRFETGDIISHPAFSQEPATRVVAVRAGEITVNQNAGYTEGSAALTPTNYKGETISTIDKVLSSYTKVAWKKGDRIINDFTDEKYLNVTEWLCIKSGISNSTNQPKFISK